MTDQGERPAPVTELDFGQALGTLFRRFSTSAGAAVEDLPGGPRGFQVMAVAAGTSCANQARIAERLGLDRTVMTYLIDDLEKAGLVERRPDPADRRARQVLLTERGRSTYVEATHRIEHVERGVLAGLSDADALLFRELLLRVAEGAGDVRSDGVVNACDVAETLAPGRSVDAPTGVRG
ncbi:MarR family transcriptional regulator [Nocardioides sp. HDW12B]|uniref:MarR family winged helix-turn-helix transcriptional regulator n=1 Tax=Nocardioides sp. HDW12B TaxID=2714939 RepID=UPI00140941FE|nr:MarR family transcriptional regulator [Nocardioides sp. HDW12B]QIK68043.1 MarR family transcriptional regulator [Nocardioides sp. HDW12B]